MVLEVNEEFITVLIVTDENGNPASGKTISYRIFDEARGVFETGSMTELGIYGIYYKSWTPDAAGYWIFEAYYTGTDFKFYDIKMYPVQKGEEADIDTIKDAVQNGTYGLNAIHDDLALVAAGVTAVKAKTDTITWTDIVALENKLKASPSVDSILFKSGGALCPSGKSIWNVLGDATITIEDIYTVINDVFDDVGDANFKLNSLGTFTARTYFKNLVTMLGWADVLGVQTLEQRLGYQTSGSIETDLNAVALESSLAKIVSHIDVWCLTPMSSVTLGINGGAADVALPDVVLDDGLIPEGATIHRVVAMIKIAVLRDTSGLDNAVNKQPAGFPLQVKESLDGSWTNAILIPDNSWAVDVSTSLDRGGDVLIGTSDIKSEVASDGLTYNFQFAAPVVDGDNLLLLDVMVGLRIYFY